MCASFKLLQMLKQIEEELPDTEGLCQWYVLDENAIPPVYKLQNIRYVYGHAIYSVFG